MPKEPEKNLSPEELDPISPIAPPASMGVFKCFSHTEATIHPPFISQRSASKDFRWHGDAEYFGICKWILWFKYFLDVCPLTIMFNRKGNSNNMMP